ncbi:Uncharacterised protein [uncultured archaeon]|nr:Uncharacterised protein [uncultured archaeon]
MKNVIFIAGIVIFAIGGYFYLTGYNGMQELILKFAVYSPEKYQEYKTMEIIGGISAVIGILIAQAGIFEKKDD